MTTYHAFFLSFFECTVLGNQNFCVRLKHQLFCDSLNYSSMSPTAFLTSTFISSGLSQQSGLHCPHYYLQTGKMILSQKTYSLGI